MGRKTSKIRGSECSELLHEWQSREWQGLGWQRHEWQFYDRKR
jgi:hypothetical protein